MSREDGAVCQQGESVQLLDIEVARRSPSYRDSYEHSFRRVEDGVSGRKATEIAVAVQAALAVQWLQICRPLSEKL
jgi:hypothetical protein